MLPRFILTPGEPAGIGPDIVLQLAQRELAGDICVLADPELLRQRAQQLGLSVELELADRHPPAPHRPGQLRVIPETLRVPVQAGQLNPANAAYVLRCLERACDACQRGEFDALITGPVHKGIINQAGIPFSGHTEFLAARTHTPQVVMMLANRKLRVALVTTHLPLREVSDAISAPWLENVVRILYQDLQDKFRLPAPVVSVCGLNPHAGEDGHLGREEIEIITPVLDKLRAEGMQLRGPLPADTAFTPHALHGVDAVLAMYHDQGLPVLKQQGFGEAVNITLGLPIIRVSVDHGTALNLAASGQANPASLLRALEIGGEMLGNKSKPNIP